MSTAEMDSNMKDYSFIWWIFTVFGIPVAFPWVIYHLINKIRKGQQKSALNKQVVMITGASSGLGEALAHAFYQCGCKLILVARRKEKLEEVKSALMRIHHNGPTYTPIVFPLDITELDSLPEAIEKILSIYNRIDILVNNAGISYRGEAVKTSIDVDIQVMQINYFAQIALAKAVLPTMIRQKSGNIVCISSVQGKIAIPYRSAYGASKHALQAWCDSVRAELNNENINITVINPGYINTDLSLNAITGDGGIYGKMDKTIKEGYLPSFVAEKVITAILQQNKEVMIAPFLVKVANFIRYIIPTLYFVLMNRRARKTTFT
ncbi:hypothetical protein PV328_008684 [Microctonus aethiopoides]|uniref:Dehydrogenase/reductase SDR family protein 7-like n=4 Tax=Microctonus aethiopoides TaxID=144406 RepID=A0AA39FJS2_9HYME|nr:hypothetical protein PV328_008684 [Microctonus aethiopoides]